MYKAPRGTQDILPEEYPYWRHIIDRIHHVCQLHGWEQFDVPIFEETALFTRGIGEATDIVEKEMYSFKDRGGTELTLRPEFTAGVMRAYLENGLHTRPQPVKLYSIGPIFRYERPQAGRYRQSTQWNVEAIGEQDAALDVETMGVAWYLYEDLGFEGLSFQINSIGCPLCRPTYSRVLVEYYRRHEKGLCDDCKRRLYTNPMRLLDCKNGGCQPIIENAPHSADYLCDECQAHYAELRRYLDLLKRSYTENHRLVRGLDYYTKTVFEVWAEGIGAQGALCGGGRYDGLAEAIGGPHTPGVGFAAGIERIILLLKAQRIAPPPLPKPLVWVAYTGKETKDVALMLLTDLRRNGIGAVLTFGDRSLKAQLKTADKAGVAYTVILGEGEIARGEVIVRHMAAGEQVTMSLPEILKWLKARVQ